MNSETSDQEAIMAAPDQVLATSAAHTFAADALGALGMPDEDAAVIADSMVWAGLRGSINHSLIRLADIAEGATTGSLSLTADWKPLRQSGNATLMDAGGTWGMLAGTYGMRHAVTAARAYGVGVTSMRNSDITSLMAWYPSHAVSERMIGIAITNTLPLMPIWGGRGKFIGNQAFSIASPAGRHDPVYIDMALAEESNGRLNRAAAAGIPLRPGIAVDADGEPTTDAARWRDGGAVLPMGGHRGSGLALIWEVLTAVLSGGYMLNEIPQPDRPCLFLMAIDPSAFLPYEEFTERVDRLVDQLTASPPAPGADRVRVPGHDGARLARERSRDGIPFPADQVRDLRELAGELGIEWPA
jgi:LDH2 family malate/lactate/ureidoglycolate dehydrogenase